jgi:DNA-binding PucR family transcriptional regulator
MTDAATIRPGLSMLSMVMVDRHDEQEILRLAAASVAVLTPCQVEACYLIRGEHLVGRGGERPDDPDVKGPLSGLSVEPGPVVMTDRDWAWAYPLGCGRGEVGYIVVSAAAEPAAEHLFVLAGLAQQTGDALSRAALYRGERAVDCRLRGVNLELARANNRLRREAADLERQRDILERLTAVAAARAGEAAGAGEAALAAALHAMTELAVAVEDQFGNLRAWAGPGPPEPYPKQSRRRRAELLAEAGRRSGPLRDQDRLIALARSGAGVLGVLALVDPDRRATEHQAFALEHAAVVLAIELAHQRDLAEAELRFRGDLVGDLLTGIHTESAVSRAAALGHDLRGAHQVLIIRWSGTQNGEGVVPAVERAARLCDVDALVSRWSGAVVMIAARPASWDATSHWVELHHALSEVLPGTRGRIGVGGVRESPSQLPRSYSEALHALAIRQLSQVGGLTSFDELGVLRLLFTSEDHSAVDQFVRDWLGVLIDYDGEHGADLVATLSQYYANGGNYDVTAAALRIHRSTLRYRLKRIRELTGHDLGGVDSRLNLQIATQAWQILHEVR